MPKYPGSIVMNNYTAKTTVFAVVSFAPFGIINLNCHLLEMHSASSNLVFYIYYNTVASFSSVIVYYNTKKLQKMQQQCIKF